MSPQRRDRTAAGVGKDVIALLDQPVPIPRDTDPVHRNSYGAVVSERIWEAEELQGAFVKTAPG